MIISMSMDFSSADCFPAVDAIGSAGNTLCPPGRAFVSSLEKTAVFHALPTANLADSGPACYDISTPLACVPCADLVVCPHCCCCCMSIS